jgi:hypothetical protein
MTTILNEKDTSEADTPKLKPTPLNSNSKEKHEGTSRRSETREHSRKRSLMENQNNPTDEEEEEVSEEQKVEAMLKAERILGKYKNTEHLKKNPRSKVSWLVHAVNEVINSPVKQMKQHKLKFENTRRAAEYNAKILKQ